MIYYYRFYFETIVVNQKKENDLLKFKQAIVIISVILLISSCSLGEKDNRENIELNSIKKTSENNDIYKDEYQIYKGIKKRRYF